MMIETNRLILRAWNAEDAKALYELAKNPNVGPSAGWPVHTSVENSREIIEQVLSKDQTYAVVLKGTDEVVGSIGLMIGGNSNLGLDDQEGEIGYWIGESYWGQGLIPEAVKVLIDYGFRELRLNKIWCAYFDGNEKSKRVQEKCGFVYQYTRKNIYWELLDKYIDEHVTLFIQEC